MLVRSVAIVRFIVRPLPLTLRRVTCAQRSAASQPVAERRHLDGADYLSRHGLGRGPAAGARKLTAM